MKWICLILLLVSFSTSAIEVAFLEVHDFNGRPLELEPGARFAHVLVRYKNKWLHSHPGLPGVALSDDPSEFGRVKSILIDPTLPEPDDKTVEFWLGKPFDHTFSWTNRNATYCTRLVAQILGVSPQPMRFEGAAWKRFPGPQPGGVGLSPDDLHAELLARDFRESDDCARYLDVSVLLLRRE